LLQLWATAGKLTQSKRLRSPATFWHAWAHPRKVHAIGSGSQFSIPRGPNLTNVA